MSQVGIKLEAASKNTFWYVGMASMGTRVAKLLQNLVGMAPLGLELGNGQASVVYYI